MLVYKCLNYFLSHSILIPESELCDWSLLYIEICAYLIIIAIQVFDVGRLSRCFIAGFKIIVLSSHHHHLSFIKHPLDQLNFINRQVHLATIYFVDKLTEHCFVFHAGG